MSEQPGTPNETARIEAFSDGALQSRSTAECLTMSILYAMYFAQPLRSGEGAQRLESYLSRRLCRR